MKSYTEESPGEQASSESGLKDENSQRLEEVTGMDENGNIFTVEETEGTVQNESCAFRMARASSVKVVNFIISKDLHENRIKDGVARKFILPLPY